MVQHQQFPLRGGPVWPGTNTLGGKLDDGSGQLTTNSKNVQINTGDTLAKRKGFVRGLDEWFSDAVCGLHRYTGENGQEYLLVADSSGISVRTPFAVPIFRTSDAYPNDDFPGDTTTVSRTWWRDPSVGYQHIDGKLRIKSGAPQPLVWFKPAASSSYQVTVDAVLDHDSTDDVIDIFIKSATDSGDGSLRLRLSPGTLTTSISLSYIDATGAETVLASAAPASDGEARAVFSYDASTRTASAEVFLDNNYTELSGTLNAVQDADLGQQSMIQLAGSGSSGVDTIAGGPV